MDTSSSTELLKFIVEELANPPLKLEFNVSSFGSLNPSGLRKIFHIVLGEIDPSYQDEFKDDPGVISNGTLNVERVLELLRVLRYWPKNNTPENIKEALEVPVPETLWEIIAWLLLKKGELKERAYLSRFLVKIQIPDDIMMDDDVTSCFEQYENQIEIFKDTHKRLQEIKDKMEKRPVNELVSDLGRIGHDIECLSRKVDSYKNKIGDFPEKEEYLKQAQLVRKARDAKAAMKRQIEVDEEKLANFERRQEILHLEIQDMIDLNDDGNPDTALNRLEKDSEILKHIVEGKLPKQIERARRGYLAMLITEKNPPLCKTNLEFQKQRFEEVSQEIAFLETLLTKNRTESQSFSEDSVNSLALLNFVREQTHNNREKATELGTQLILMRNEFKEIIESKRKREKRSCQGEGDADSSDWVIKPEGYKDYVKQMRKKASEYKEKRKEIQNLQAEIGNLSVTKFIVDGELKKSEAELRDVEVKLGIVGLSDLQEQLENTSNKKCSEENKKLEGVHCMTDLAKSLNSQLWDNKSRWQKIMSQVSEKRNELTTLTAERCEAQLKMEAEIGPINSAISDIKQEMAETLKNYEWEKLEASKMEAELPIMTTELARANGPSFSGHGPYAKRNNIDRVRGKILEAERLKQELTTDVEQLEDVQEYEQNQKGMWDRLTKFLQVKARVLQSQRGNSAETDTVSLSKTYDTWENPSRSAGST